MMTMGIYQITNRVNGKMYIGSAKCLKERWQEHRKQLINNSHHSLHLQRAWNKHGSDAFEFSILKLCETSDGLLGLEQGFLDTVRPWDKKIGYNICPVAGSMLGFKHSPETKAKMSDAKKGKVGNRLGQEVSLETRQKISGSKKGKTSNRKGVVLSAEVKQRMAESHKGNQSRRMDPGLEAQVLLAALTSNLSRRGVARLFHVSPKTVANVIRRNETKPT